MLTSYSWTRSRPLENSDVAGSAATNKRDDGNDVRNGSASRDGAVDGAMDQMASNKTAVGR